MSFNQSLQQKLLQKLSPQQIQLMKLLQVPTANLEERIKEELEENPALEQSEDGFDENYGEEMKDEFAERRNLKKAIVKRTCMKISIYRIMYPKAMMMWPIINYAMRIMGSRRKKPPCLIKWKPAFMKCSKLNWAC